MSTALAERPDVSVEGEIIEHPTAAAPLTLFGTTDPTVVVERATAIATALADVISQKHLTARIGNRDHVLLEGWTLLGSMLGVFGDIEWTRAVESGWEARAVARTLSGGIVGSAEAMCTRKERTWANRDEYAIRSMAQTRALSKALRLPLGFIVELAGYAATPADEIEQSEPGARGERAPRHTRAGDSTPAPTPRTKGEALGRLADVMKEHGLGFAQIDEMAKARGIDRGKGTVEDILRLIAAIEQPDEASAHAAPVEGEEAPAASSPHSDGASGGSSDDDSDAAAPTPDRGSRPPAASAPAAPTDEELLAAAGPGAEIVPPKPGTPEYRALPNGTERAKAKAWHDAHKAPEPQQESLSEQLGGPTSD